MDKIVIVKDNAEAAEIQLDQQEYSIGRDADADIRLNDPSVSRHHARLIKAYTDFFIEDLGSTNGSQLNGRSISKHVFKSGDKLNIGSFSLCFVSEVSAEEGDVDKTVVIQPDVVKAARSRRSSSYKITPKSATLRFFRGPQKGSSEKVDRSLYTIGKPGSNVAVIARRPKGFYLLHIGGDSYPRINDQEIQAGGAGVQLNEGDVLEVGEYLAEISFG